MTTDTHMLDYPVDRNPKCPFDLPAALTEAGADQTLRRVRIWDGSTPWLITGNQLLRSLSADKRLSTNDHLDGFPHWNAAAALQAPHRPRMITNSDGAEHTRLRRMTTGSFSFKRIEAMRPKIQKITDDLIDDMLAGPQPVNLVSALSLPLPSLVICELLGVPYTDHEFFEQKAAAGMGRRANPTEAAQAMAALLAYMRDHIEASDADGMGVVAELGGHVRTGELSVDEAAMMALGLLIAGHETTANMISLGVAALLQNTDQMVVMRDSQDPKVIADAVEELLRYLAIVDSGQRRIAVEDIEADGKTIRAGDGVILDFASGNWDSRVFAFPGELDFERGARGHVAFGFGAHGCIGQQLARAELQIVYPTLFRRVPGLELTRPVQEIPFKSDALAYGVYELPVRW